MSDIFDDNIWDYVLMTKLNPYMPNVRKFWSDIQSMSIKGTGVYPIKYADSDPAGLMYRVTNTPIRSPIKHVQVFPFVPVKYLQLTNVAGGAARMVSRVCADNRFTIDEFTIIEKSNLPSTYHQGQFVAFVPTDVLNNAQQQGRWIYVPLHELVALADGIVSEHMAQRFMGYIRSE